MASKPDGKRLSLSLPKFIGLLSTHSYFLVAVYCVGQEIRFVEVRTPIFQKTFLIYIAPKYRMLYSTENYKRLALKDGLPTNARQVAFLTEIKGQMLDCDLIALSSSYLTILRNNGDVATYKIGGPDDFLESDLFADADLDLNVEGEGDAVDRLLKDTKKVMASVDVELSDDSDDGSITDEGSDIDSGVSDGEVLTATELKEMEVIPVKKSKAATDVVFADEEGEEVVPELIENECEPEIEKVPTANKPRKSERTVSLYSDDPKTTVGSRVMDDSEGGEGKTDSSLTSSPLSSDEGSLDDEDDDETPYFDEELSDFGSSSSEDEVDRGPLSQKSKHRNEPDSDDDDETAIDEDAPIVPLLSSVSHPAPKKKIRTTDNALPANIEEADLAIGIVYVAIDLTTFYEKVKKGKGDLESVVMNYYNTLDDNESESRDGRTLKIAELSIRLAEKVKTNMDLCKKEELELKTSLLRLSHSLTKINALRAKIDTNPTKYLKDKPEIDRLYTQTRTALFEINVDILRVRDAANEMLDYFNVSLETMLAL